jgi:hypothetical protein
MAGIFKRLTVSTKSADSATIEPQIVGIFKKICQRNVNP